MKSYKLRFTQADFTSKDGGTWRTPVIDLYDNSQYRNYSVRKSPNGSNLLGDGTYTGLENPSEIGFVDSGRFIDTSGVITIDGWRTEVKQSLSAPVLHTLSIYSTDDGSLDPYYLHATPTAIDDWAVRRNLVEGRLVLATNQYRYTFFELDITSEASIPSDFDIELIVTVLIQEPVVDGWFSGTRFILNKFPEWMAMREYDPADPYDENKATPETVGGQLINAVAGQWVTELRNDITVQQLQASMEGLDPDAKAWVYKAIDIPDDVYSVTRPDDQSLAQAGTLVDFYASSDSSDVYFLNSSTHELFTIQKYNKLKINGVEYEQEPHQVWNTFDDLGLVVDLRRLQLESNDSFSKRVIDSYINPPGTSRERLSKALRRELNLWQYEGATPDSNYEGATPGLLEISDIESSDVYFNPDGTAKDSFYDLVEKLARKYPITWGLIRYGEALWDSQGVKREGYSLLEKTHDTTLPVEAEVQSGVGDLSDLKVLPPNFHRGEEEFDVTLLMKAKSPSVSPHYTQVSLSPTIQGTAQRTVATYEELRVWFTLEYTIGPDTYYGSVILGATYYGGDPGVINLGSYDPAGTWPPPPATEEAKVYFQWVNDDGYLNEDVEWRNKVSNEVVDTPVLASSIANITVTPGFYNYIDDTYDDAPGGGDEDLYSLSFNGQVAELGHTGAPSISLSSAAIDFPASDQSLVFETYKFTVVEDKPDGFVSAPETVNVVVNEGNVQSTDVVSVGPFFWNPANTAGTQKIVIQLAENNNLGEPGAYTVKGTFVPAADIRVNGSNSWDADGKLEIAVGSDIAPEASFDLTFDISTGVMPEGLIEYSDVEYTYSLTGQKINEIGPFKNGKDPVPGAQSTLLKVLYSGQADWGFANDDEIYWIGVHSTSNPAVKCWLGSNRVVETDDVPVNFSPNNIYRSTIDGSLTGIEVNAALSSVYNDNWQPFVHSGWAFEDGTPWYLYANPRIQSVSSFPHSVENYQGAPIVVKNPSGVDLDQFGYEFGATPPDIGEVVEIKHGTGSTFIYASHKNISNVVVKNLLDDSLVALATTSPSSNEIESSGAVFERSVQYEVTYTVDEGFYVYGGQVYLLGSQEVGSYTIYSESEPYLPATPAPVKLSPLVDFSAAGFIFVDHEEATPASLELRVSPKHILGNNKDYAFAVAKALDKWGNPVSGVEIEIATPATLDSSETHVTTDEHGSATFYIESNSTDPLPAATVQLNHIPDGSPTISVSEDIKVGAPIDTHPELVIMAEAEMIEADGQAKVHVFGVVRQADGTPASGAVIHWKKDRDIRATLMDHSLSVDTATPGQLGQEGQVTADANGRFTIGPFISQNVAGFWFVSAETTSTGSLIGDITYWYEFNRVTNILDIVALTPTPDVQDATPVYEYPQMMATPGFPVTLDERDYELIPNSGSNNWVPPTWYPIDKYKQYQMGLMGGDYHEPATPNPAHPSILDK